MLYTCSVEPDRDFDYFTPCNNKYITYITLVTEIPSTPYLVYCSCHCCASDEISGHTKMLFCIHPWLPVQFSYKPVTGNAQFFRPCSFRNVRSVFMAIFTFLTIMDYSWQQRIGFEHFKDSFYDRHWIFPTVQKCREEKDIVLQNDDKIFAFSFALFKMFIPSLMQMMHCWGASAVCINISNEDVNISIISW